MKAPKSENLDLDEDDNCLVTIDNSHFYQHSQGTVYMRAGRSQGRTKTKNLWHIYMRLAQNHKLQCSRTTNI